LSDPQKQAQTRALQKAWASGKVATTMEIAKGYVKSYPKSAYGWFVFGDVLLEIARYDEAKIALEKAIKRCKPNNLALPYESMGHLYKAKGNNRTAEKWYRKALEIRPNNPYILVFIGAALAKQGKFTQAKKFHRKAIKVAGPEADEAYYNLGLILRAEEKYNDARKAFEEAIKLDPNYKEVKKALKDVNYALNMQGDI